MKRIESDSNPSVKQWKKLLTKKEREKTGTFLIEGPHLVEEALSYNADIHHLIIEENFQIPGSWDKGRIPVWQVTEKIMKSLSETEKPQGVMAVCGMADSDSVVFAPGKKFVLIDGVQDPGNLGTIIRTADSAGVDAVILGEGTVDVYNGKVMRSAQGSVFHLPVVKMDLKEAVEGCKNNGITLYATSLKEASDMREASPNHGFALLVGNEGSGVKEEWLKAADEKLIIPIFGKAESLNVAVATGILLYELQRTRK
ncbi:TrmH family RNA methyltransferase [Fictibacillus aquaticus]|uniref:RNA methyltransferase n=1 Tax=Fictibacillus aquaticus TaxID=2021314 RepID=A0A235FA45_9BACL|nr:RNA methyltransferase [Fictibacillus aquaticus]OYD58142.1 RNA methyltransferase [Fictibacillus aquaticus]